MLFGIGLFLFYYFITTTYSLYFGPLSNIPGPFFAKVTGWVDFYYAKKGYRHIWIWQCHQIYGSIIRIGPNTVLVNTASGFKTIYNKNANVKKGKLYEFLTKTTKHISTFNITDRHEHSKQRRVLNQVFSESAIRSAETVMIQNIDRWCELLLDGKENEWTEPINFAWRINALVFDVICHLALGKSFNVKEPGENKFKHLPLVILKFARLVYPIIRSPLLPLWVYLKPRGLDDFFTKHRPQVVKDYDEFVDTCVEQRIERERQVQQDPLLKKHDEPDDIFHILMNAKDPQTGLPVYTADRLNAEARLLITAGSDTTSTALCSTFFYLSRYSRVLKRATDEIRTIFQSSDEIRGGSKLASCVYLRACIDESMRSGGLSELPRTVQKGGLELDGHFIPEGTEVGSSQLALNHNEAYFGNDAWGYRPERWIVDEATGVTAEDVALAQSAFMPFSNGPYNCVGRKLAMQEMLITTAKIIYNIDIRAVDGNSLGGGDPKWGWGRRDPKHYNTIDAFIAVRNGPMLQFRRKEATNAEKCT
ncbi:cytochrome P450 monooxygenase-like protein [Halenospora varia]|nr:cytochrome P450 monooxygenase-like protein [Halenospora varia]